MAQSCTSSLFGHVCTLCRKLTLEALSWFELGDGTQQGSTFDAFKAEVKAKLPEASGGAREPVVEAAAEVEVTPPTGQSAPAGAETTEEGGAPSFWVDKFGEQSCVSWEEFEREFTAAYLGEFDENMQPWVLKTVKVDMFGSSDEVTRGSFEAVCESGRDFGKLVTRHVMERWAIQEIFSMDSSVRLTSIENLGTSTHLPVHTVGLCSWCQSLCPLPLWCSRQDPEPSRGGCPVGAADGDGPQHPGSGGYILGTH